MGSEKKRKDIYAYSYSYLGCRLMVSSRSISLSSECVHIVVNELGREWVGMRETDEVEWRVGNSEADIWKWEGGKC